MFRPGSVLRVCAVIAAAAALTLAFAVTAFAMPSDPILGFSDLRSALAASPTHHLTGYMKTVVEGSEITNIPLTVLTVPKTGTADGSLIMFEATGTLIAKYGGIVAGMSGSPVYVDDGTGTDKLIGAVSYGDYFTLGGTGLATPIESMMKLETSYPAQVVPLSTPLITSNGLISKIIVAPNPEDYLGASRAGAFVARPLASVFIGGLSPRSTGYKALQKDLSARGVIVVALDAPLSSGGGDETPFSTEMTAGASIATLVSRGDLWLGGIGTVTYANAGNVLAFGHPAYWSGATSLYMLNAWIEGVWPNSYEPYKVGEPGALRGTITQDRNAGVLGKVDQFPAETTITARAVNIDNGDVTTSTVFIPRALISQGFADGQLVGMSAYVAGSRLFDQAAQPGSAHTTMTVEVSDGAHVYHVSVPNYTDSSDIANAASAGVSNAVAQLQSVLAYGTENLEILSVDLTGEYSTHRAGAQIVGVQAPAGLHVGSNAINIQALVYGRVATQTVPATLVIPAGTPMGGSIQVSAVSESDMGSTIITNGAGMQVTVDSSGALSQVGRKTIAQLAGELNKTLPDTALTLTYAPNGGGSSSASSKAVSTVVIAPWPIAGDADVDVTSIRAAAEPGVVAYGDFADITGTVGGVSDDTVVSLYGTPAGSSTEVFLGTQTATDDEEFSFDFPVDEAFTTATYRVHIDGTDSTTAANTSVVLQVRAAASLSTSASSIKRGKKVTLTAMVYPGSSAGGSVTFEQLVGRTWRKITTKGLTRSGSSAKAAVSWKPGKGTHKVRARYLGGTYNCATTTGIRVITVK